jgi:putative acetyltransferase
MIIRPLRADAVARLAAFARWTYVEAFGASFAPGDLEPYLRESLSDEYFRTAVQDDDFLLAEEAGSLLGFVQFGTVANGGGQELRRLYVHPEFQNRGIGSQLLDAALAHPRLASVPVLFIDVWEHNRGARALYERYGFAVVGARLFVSASGDTTGRDLIMERRKPPAAADP